MIGFKIALTALIVFMCTALVNSILHPIYTKWKLNMLGLSYCLSIVSFVVGLIYSIWNV